VNRTSASDRSPRVSEEQWQREKKTDQASALFIRGNLYMKLKDYRSAQQDFRDQLQATPTAGNCREARGNRRNEKDWNSAITKYSRAFA